MEFNNFNKELNESEDSDKDDAGSGTPKKKKAAGSAAVNAEIMPGNPTPEQKLSTFETFLQKLKGDKSAPKAPEVPLLGIPKPENTDTEQHDTKLDEPHRRSEYESSDAEAVSDFDELDPQELHEAALESVELRLHEADSEMHELPLDLPSSDAAEAAARTVLLQNMQASLQTGHQSVELAMEDAAKTTQEQIESGLRDEPEQEDHNAVSIHEENNELSHDMRPDSNGNGGANLHPEMPPIEDTPDFPPPLPPPVSPGFNERPAIETSAPPAAVPRVETGAFITTADSLHRERVAQGRGLLVGLLVGHFIGKRRGRIKSEKILLPVQRKLEKQITDLQESITQKEQHIKSLVRDKFASIKSHPERQKFIDKMSETRQATKPADRQEIKLTNTAVVQAASPEAVSKPVTRYAEAAIIGSRAVGELVAGGVLLAAVSPNIPKHHNSIETIKDPEKLRTPFDQPPVIRFDKKVEDFSRTELLQTAQKIKIEGVNLKEMLELGRMNELGLRRIVKEFLEGGSISAVLSKELQEKELKFERDPRLRQLVSSGRPQDSGGASGSFESTENQAIQNIGLSAMNMAFKSDDTSKPGPIPDKATLQQVRKQQVTAVGGTLLMVILLILVALWLTR